MYCKKCGKEINTLYQTCNLLTIGTRCEVYYICDVKVPRFIGKKFYYPDDPEILNCKYINYVKGANFPKFCSIIYDINTTIIYEFIEGRTLEEEFESLSKTQLFKLLINIIEQLLIINKQNFYYLDINKSNIVIKNNKPYFIDFNSVFKRGSFVKRKILFGSKTNIPPEYFISNDLLFDKYNVFSIGLLIFEKIYKFNPYLIEDYYNLDCWFWCDNQNNHNRENCLIKFMNENTKDEITKYIILKCLEYEPDERIELDKLKIFLYINSN